MSLLDPSLAIAVAGWSLPELTVFRFYAEHEGCWIESIRQTRHLVVRLPQWRPLVAGVSTIQLILVSLFEAGVWLRVEELTGHEGRVCL